MNTLFNDPSRKLINVKITPGDKKVTREELCAEINKAMANRVQRSAARSAKPPTDVRELVASL